MAGESARKLAAALRELSKVPAQISKDYARWSTQRLREGYAEGKDPFGNSWAPLAKATLARGRTPPPLTDTTAMRDSTEAVPAPGAGVTFKIGPWYAVIHYEGAPAANIPAREMLPHGGLPPKWRAELARMYHVLTGKRWGARG